MTSHRSKRFALTFGAPLLVFAVVLGVLSLANRSSDRFADGASFAPGALAPTPRNTEELIEGLQRRVAARPDDASVYAALGDAYLQRVRETGDPGLYVRAERAYDEALRRDPEELTAVTGAGALALSRHDFRAGLRLGERAQRLAPEVVRPYAVIVDGQIELGRYEAAARTLQRFIDLKPTLAAYSRVSYFRELHGDLGGALRAMRLAVAASGGSGEASAYVQTLLGRLEFDRGRLDAAEAQYRRADAITPGGYLPAQAGLARIDAAQGEFGAAIRSYRRVVERLPLLEYTIALAEAELAAGRNAAAERDLALVKVQGKLLRAAGVNVDVELALFEADHGSPERAVALAAETWRQAPSVRSADALSWALNSAGRIGAAAGMSKRAMKLGSRDPLFLYHAGQIAVGAGEAGRARKLLGRLVAQSPSFNPLYGSKARQALEGLQ